VLAFLCSAFIDVAARNATTVQPAGGEAVFEFPTPHRFNKFTHWFAGPGIVRPEGAAATWFAS